MDRFVFLRWPILFRNCGATCTSETVQFPDAVESFPLFFSSSSWQTVELIVVGNKGRGRTVDSGTRNRTSDARKPCKLGRLGCLVCNFVIRFFWGGDGLVLVVKHKRVVSKSPLCRKSFCAPTIIDLQSGRPSTSI